MSGYVPEVTALLARVEPLADRTKRPYPRWISTPDGDEGSEWCSDCGYFKVRNLRRHDRRRREDYILDGGWRTEEDHFCFCAGCGVQLDVCLTDYGVQEAIATFEECGFSTSRAHDAYEISELLNAVEYRSDDDAETEDTRARVIAIAQQFLDPTPKGPTHD